MASEDCGTRLGKAPGGVVSQANKVPWGVQIDILGTYIPGIRSGLLNFSQTAAQVAQTMVTSLFEWLLECSERAQWCVITHIQT